MIINSPDKRKPEQRWRHEHSSAAWVLLLRHRVA
jgi:hypothetical protein